MLTKSLVSKTVEGILNEAVHSELYASQLYRHVANQLQRIGYFGAQKFFAGESADELTHYQRHADYLNDRGTVARMPTVEAINDPIKSLGDALELAYETELQLGKDYERWYKACSEDMTTQRHLLFFLEEQQTSVGQYGDLLARMARAGSNEAAVLLIDQEMGED
jgi:ferritin